MEEVNTPVSREIAKPFKQTLFGRLPNELLDNVAAYLGHNELITLALIGTKLRAVVEHRLYGDIKISSLKDRERELDGNSGNEIWPLCRTLAHRLDIAKIVRIMDIIAIDETQKVELPGTTILLDQVFFAPAFHIELLRANLAGMTLQRVPNLENLTISMPAHPEDWQFVVGGIEELILKFGDTARDQVTLSSALPLLPNLRQLNYDGTNIHWALLTSPHLHTLHIHGPCDLLPENSPTEVNQALKHMNLTCRSAILNADSMSMGPRDFCGFMAHFPCLESLALDIVDTDYMHSVANISLQQHGSYLILVKNLEPAVSMLRNLTIDIRLAHDQVVVSESMVPCHGFAAFTALETLTVPYECLFEPRTQSSLPEASDILPQSLVTLEIFHPRITLYDWLERLPFVRTELQNLRKVTLHCHEILGDGYEVFAFISYLHRVFAVLKSIDIELELKRVDKHWDLEWDDYDLEVMRLVAWHGRFGVHITGMVFGSKHNFMKAIQQDEELRASQWAYYLFENQMED